MNTEVHFVMADLLLKEIIPFTFNDRHSLLEDAFTLIGYKEGTVPYKIKVIQKGEQITTENKYDILAIFNLETREVEYIPDNLF